MLEIPNLCVKIYNVFWPEKKNLHIKAHATCSIPFIYVNYNVNPWKTWKISYIFKISSENNQ